MYISVKCFANQFPKLVGGTMKLQIDFEFAIKEESQFLGWLFRRREILQEIKCVPSRSS